MAFHLPGGWTLRKVASALVREWLPPFRAEPAAKAARWVVQSVVEDRGGTGVPLWEAGISTSEYEARLDRPDLCWAIRATAGRGKGTILARLAMSQDQPDTFELECFQTAFPPALFDEAKVQEFLHTEAAPTAEDLFAALLTKNSFAPVTP